MSHTVTITRLPDETTDDFAYTIGGTHDYSCGVLDICNEDHGPVTDEVIDADELELMRHGVAHTYRWGDWLVEGTRCGIEFADCIEEHIWEMDPLELGTFKLEVEWDGDNWHAWPTTPVQQNRSQS